MSARVFHVFLLVAATLLLASFSTPARGEPARWRAVMVVDMRTSETDIARTHRRMEHEVVERHGRQISLKRFARKAALDSQPDIPPTILLVQSDDREVVLANWWPGLVDRALDEWGLVVLNAPQPVLCVPDPSGGTAWQANPWDVIALSEPRFLRRAGQVTSVEDLDDDGEVDLLMLNSAWEATDLFSRAGAPAVWVFCQVREGRLEPDVARTRVWAEAEIDRLDATIRELIAAGPGGRPARLQTAVDDPLLKAILERYLYRLGLGEGRAARVELDKALRHRHRGLFYFTDPDARTSPPPLLCFPVETILEELDLAE